MTQEVRNIAIIGAGLMGNGIAQISLMAGYNVMMVDVKQEFIDKGVAAIEDGLKRLEAKGQLNAAEVMGKFRTSLDLASAVKDTDFIIEAVVENMDVKKSVFKTCDENSPPHCIISTNTSTMSITEIASATNKEDKCIGIHFFNPPPLMRLVEVIKGEKSSDEAMDIGVRVGESLPCLRGSRFVARVLKDRPGFIVNRLNAPVSIYSSYITDLAFEKGIPWEQIDADTGGIMPMPPYVLADYVGLDTAYHVANYYAKTLSPDFKPGKILTKMVEEGKLGRKTGQGYYDWSKGTPKPDMSKKAGLLDLELVMAIRLNEGCRLIEEGVVNGWKIIDDANMAGMNTPGPFSAGKNNYERWTKKLDEFVEKSGKEYLRPCELMRTGKFVKMRK
ncbi:MAG: 3-hydroxyacyl-CoA dehydrogenase family protein [Promethearchaeota archaeon]|nr:MAG: 3-hydroxyacyl-CoA dehydrogenase family protein [Candidatus Lokiarchaeota archaeon]